MIERFRQLAPREQIILGVGAALAFLIIGWSFVWTPLVATVDELRESVRDQSRLMVDLKRAAGLASTAGAGADAAGSGPQDLQRLADQAARPIGLSSSFTNQRPDANDVDFRITIQNASFALFIDWLIALDREHGVQARVVRLQPGTRGPGFVSGEVVLSRN